MASLVVVSPSIDLLLLEVNLMRECSVTFLPLFFICSQWLTS